MNAGRNKDLQKEPNLNLFHLTLGTDHYTIHQEGNNKRKICEYTESTSKILVSTYQVITKAKYKHGVFL